MPREDWSNTLDSRAAGWRNIHTWKRCGTGTGHWALDWTLDTGHWILDTGSSFLKVLTVTGRWGWEPLVELVPEPQAVIVGALCGLAVLR